MRFSTCVPRDFTLERTVERERGEKERKREGENFGEDSDSYFVHFRDGGRFFYISQRRQRIAALVLSPREQYT